jgi:hypothetical protein
MNDGISASCENVSSATLRVIAEITAYTWNVFIYIEKEKLFEWTNFGDGIATHDVMMIM